MHGGCYANGFRFDSHLADITFFQVYILPLRFRFRVYLLRLLCFYQAYCTLVMCYYYVTGGI